MADAVTSRTLQDNAEEVISIFTNLSDGTGESAVVKVDVSGLTPVPKALTIEEIWYAVSGMVVTVLFDATSDDKAILLQGDGHMNLKKIGGIPDPKSSGYTGDILFTTSGHTAADSYSIVLRCRKRY